MAVQVILQRDAFQWVDLCGPTYDELESVAKKFSLHQTSVQDCLQPEHLPKFEDIEGVTFLILRIFDQQAAPNADSIQEMTRKVALFYAKGFLLTIHRVELPAMKPLFEKWKHSSLTAETAAPQILIEILRLSVLGYGDPIDEAEEAFSKLESTVVRGHGNERSIEDLYFLKRRISVVKRMIRLHEHVVHASALMHVAVKRLAPQYTDLREEGDRLYLYGDELNEDITNLVNVYISLASHRTNEVVRVLTVFSVFFLPLTFIAGIYGMNFRFMPELEHPGGYPFVLIIMGIVSLVIYLWFRRRGWLR